MSASKTKRYAMFGLLYFAQGAIMGYFAALNAIYLLSFNLSMSQIGLVGAIAMLPFVIKIFLGMLSDRVNLLGFGYRKPYIIVGLVIQSICLLVIPWVHPASQYNLFVILAFTLMSGMALYDTCTDGLALDTTPIEEEGTIQGFMVGGRALGVVFVGGVGFLAQHLSWAAAFGLLALLTIIPLPLVLWGSVSENRSSSQRFEWKAFSAFRQPAIICLGLLGALYSLITNGANEIINPFLQMEYHIEIATAGLMTTLWGIGVAIGGLTGGKLADRLGHVGATRWAMLISLAAILALSFIFGLPVAWLLVALFGMAYGFYETVYFATAMRYTDARIAATMFSILMAVANLGTAIGLGASGLLVDLTGFRPAFAILALLNLLALPLMPKIFGGTPAPSHPQTESRL